VSLELFQTDSDHAPARRTHLVLQHDADGIVRMWCARTIYRHEVDAHPGYAHTPDDEHPLCPLCLASVWVKLGHADPVAFPSPSVAPNYAEHLRRNRASEHPVMRADGLARVADRAAFDRERWGRARDYLWLKVDDDTFETVSSLKYSE
jgi:hypothetical protein